MQISNKKHTNRIGFDSKQKDVRKNLENIIVEKTKELTHNVASLESYKLAINESNMVSRADLHGNIIYVNDNFCKVSGYTRDEILGKSHNIIRHPDTPKEIFKDLWQTIQSKKIWKGVIQNKGKLDSYWVDITILPILDGNDNIVEYIAVRHDITKMIEQQVKLDELVNTDTLTGFGNRYKLGNDIDNGTLPALAILNIDNFSQVNDFYGHKIGDDVIKTLGNEIYKLIKHTNCELYHLQGDEYVIYNKNINKKIFLKNIMQIGKLITQVPFEINDEPIHLNLTTAVSFEEKHRILPTADMALKVAKQNNIDFLIYSDEISLNSIYENNIKWTKKIKFALENDKIIPVFQQIVSNFGEMRKKYEALVRLEDDDKLISPFFFLDISKKTKHYLQITKCMIKKSFERFKNEDIEFSVNLTIEDILNEQIKEYIFEMLESYNIGHHVIFEIVESESIENFKNVIEFIQEVKRYGCKIAIDDFGTGYSNFEYLLKIKADYIKIDGSMIKNIDQDQDARIVVSVIVDFAKKMGIKTIAEFVENEAIYKTVRELGIDYSQGYYFASPSINL